MRSSPRAARKVSPSRTKSNPTGSDANVEVHFTRTQSPGWIRATTSSRLTLSACHDVRRHVKHAVTFPPVPLKLALLASIILTLLIPTTARASVLDAIVVAHRGATTTAIPEGTRMAYSYAVQHHADILDGDIRWTRDGPDADKVGTMILLHDSTLDRLTNCTGYVKDWLWSNIYDKCRTDVAKQRLWRLVDLLAYARYYGKKVNLEIKPSSITWDEARQLYNNIKGQLVRVTGFYPAATYTGSPLNKIRQLDFNDTSHRLEYALIAHGTPAWPSVAAIKTYGSTVDVRLDIPPTIAANYRANGIRLNVWTLKNVDGYVRAAKLSPWAVTVDDAGRWERWVESQT